MGDTKEDNYFIGGERVMDFVTAMGPENFEKLAGGFGTLIETLVGKGVFNLSDGFGALIETLVEKGVLTLEDCGSLSGRYNIRKAGVR